MKPALKGQPMLLDPQFDHGAQTVTGAGLTGYLAGPLPSAPPARIALEPYHFTCKCGQWATVGVWDGAVYEARCSKHGGKG